MPWQNLESFELTKKAQFLLKKHYNFEIKSQVYIVTEEEMVVNVLEEQTKIGRTTKELEMIKIELKYILGRYFATKDEIWLVEGKGVVIDVLFHELLHVKQKCTPHREHIVDYLTYKITRNKEFIKDSVVKDWEEIEKNEGLKKILERLQKEGDCEEFE